MEAICFVGKERRMGYVVGKCRMVKEVPLLLLSRQRERKEMELLI
jgi:hypothetical protein